MHVLVSMSSIENALSNNKSHGRMNNKLSAIDNSDIIVPGVTVSYV